MEFRQTPKTGLMEIQMERFDETGSSRRADQLAIEEPLEIRLEWMTPEGLKNQKSISITLRTPGDDFALALGFLVTEGLVPASKPFSEHFASIGYCGPPLAPLGHSNIVKLVYKNPQVLELGSMERHFYVNSSCGVCGKASIDALRARPNFETASVAERSISRRMILELPQRLRAAQEVFESTGGLHASALFDSRGSLLDLKEDVGRHNALDKVVGAAYERGVLPLSDSILMLSGRISFELVQKASQAGIPVIAALGAPSSLALELAIDRKMTLIGFIREGRFNVYHDPGRLL
ncbi:MAG: formate dehydrogenase accessory sulfurtransferase FdhD [Bdellovibrionales bacterium]|nr:formate dehydrogenase accessory sulfurtransferase FdhD [Bdellovibrionales bacterium]